MLQQYRVTPAFQTNPQHGRGRRDVEHFWRVNRASVKSGTCVSGFKLRSCDAGQSRSADVITRRGFYDARGLPPLIITFMQSSQKRGVGRRKALFFSHAFYESGGIDRYPIAKRAALRALSSCSDNVESYTAAS